MRRLEMSIFRLIWVEHDEFRVSMAILGEIRVVIGLLDALEILPLVSLGAFAASCHLGRVVEV